MYDARLDDWTQDPSYVGWLTGVECRMLAGALRVYLRAARPHWHPAQSFRSWAPTIRASERFQALAEERAFSLTFRGRRGGLMFKGHEIEPGAGEAFFEVCDA